MPHRLLRHFRVLHGLSLTGLGLGLASLSACVGLTGASAAGTPPTFYFSDCQPGAAPDCVAGNNSNRGTTPTAPKRTPSSIDVNDLPPGSKLLFVRGGAWTWSLLRLENLDATPAAPLVLGDYGSGALPLLRVANGTAFEVGGGWNNTSNDGGYTIRNLKLDGLGTAQWGLWLRDNVRSIVLEGVEITGFKIAIHSQSGRPHGVDNFTLRDSKIERNAEMGILGSFRNGLVEGNVFAGNNFSGSALHHAIYLGGNGSDVVIRNNRFLRNSVVNGQCTGGNITAHGQWDRVKIENNLIEQDRAAGSCYGISITPGYTTPEAMRNFVVRANVIVNVGGCAVCAGAAPGIVVENNRIINTQATYQVGVLIPAGVDPSSAVSAGDAADSGAVVRNNTICFKAPGNGSSGVRVKVDGATVSDNAVHTGSAASNGACAP